MSQTLTHRTNRNGVDTGKLFATLDLVKAQPELAQFRFRATNRWISGTHNRSTIAGFYGAGGEDTTRENGWSYDADHPAVLCGDGNGPTPVEFLLHALAACLTSGLANIAAARGITLHSVESTVTGDIDLRGIFGQGIDVRNGFERIDVSFKISGDASDERLHRLIEQSRMRSAVFDVITNRVPVTVNSEVTHDAQY
jgi:uncharacterized OsmC-like protein